MTDQTKAKPDGWLYPNRESEEVRVMTSGEYDERMYASVKDVLPGGGIPIRIIPATDPTASEAAAQERKRVIGEVREWAQSIDGPAASPASKEPKSIWILAEALQAKLDELDEVAGRGIERQRVEGGR